MIPRGVVPFPVCVNKVRNSPISANQVILQLAKAAVICRASCAETCLPLAVLLAQTYLQNQLCQLI